MNKTTPADKNKANNKPTYKQTEHIKNPKAYYKSKEYWKAINDGQSTCSTCKQQILEGEAMNAPNGDLIHEACYEPGDDQDY